MERGLMMLLHALLLGVLLYLLMVYGLKQSTRVAEDRSVLLGALVLAYMVLFGHGLPTKLNKNLMIKIYPGKLIYFFRKELQSMLCFSTRGSLASIFSS